MKNNQPFQPAEWSPQQRMLWLASKGAPFNFRLTTLDEINIVQKHLIRADVLEKECNAAIQQLDSYGYWVDEPDLKNSAGAAAFDARRYERATTGAIERLEKVYAFLTLLGTKYSIPAVMFDLVHETAGVVETLNFLKAQRDARRERIT